MKLRLVPASAVFMLSLLSAARGQEPNEKSGKYYETLVKRPVPGAVFDRFYNAWLDTGTLEEMESFLRKAAEAPDENGAHRLLLAFYYSKQNEHARAAEEFKKALERNPGSAEAWQHKATAESKLLDYPAALASLEKALAAKPGKLLEAQLTQFKGRLLARDGRIDEALKVWQQLIADSPDDAALMEDIVELQCAEGLNREALATARTLLDKTTDPYQKVQRRMRVGDLLARTGDRDAAVTAYSECLEETGADSWMEKEILAQIEQVFRRDDAVTALNGQFAGLVKKHPQRLSLRRHHARLLAATGDADGAIQTFQEILKLAPGDRSVREDFISLLKETKRTADAIAQMEELIRLQPADAELPARLAELHFEAGNSAAANSAIELFLAKSDQSESAYLRAAALLERCRLAEASLALYRRTAAKFPASEGAGDALATALHRFGRKEEAAAEWRKLAAGADRTRLGNVARSASARDEHSLAWELLSARASDFQNDPVFLTQLCDEALRLDKCRETMPHARQLVSLAKDAVAMETALTTAVRMASGAKEVEHLITELAQATAVPDRCLLAELLEKSGRRREAGDILESIAGIAPEMAASVSVRLFAARGDDTSAARALQALVESPGGQKPVHVQRLVELLTRAGKTDDALHWVPVWKRLSPGAPVPWLREAALHKSTGRSAQALQTLRQAAALFEDNADLKAALASAYREEGKFNEADRLYTTMYEDAKDVPDKIRLSGELARVAKEAGRLDELIESFEERRRNNRTSAVPLLSLAEIYRFTENEEARRTVLMEASRIAPDNKELRMEIIRTAESEGDWDRGIQLLRELAASDTSGSINVKLAAMLFNAGREQEALQLMTSLMESGKVDARRAESMAASLAAARSWTECARFLTAVVAKYPADYRLAYLLAVSLEEGGDSSGALTAFRQLTAMKIELPGGPVRAHVPSSASSSLTTNPVLLRIASPSVTLSLQTREAVARLSPELNVFRQAAPLLLQAYKYKRMRGGLFSTARLAAGSTSVPLPSSIEEVTFFALPHLTALSQDNPETRSAIIADLQAAEIPNADLLLETGNAPALSNVRTMELYLQNPDRPALQILMAASFIQSKQGEPRMIVELAEKLRASRPDLSEMLLMTLAPKENHAFADLCFEATQRALARIESAPLAKLTVVSMLAGSGTLTINGEVQAPRLNSRLEDLLYPRMLDLYRSIDRTDPLRVALFPAVQMRYAEKKDYAKLVELLDIEMAGGNSFAPTAGVRASAVRSFITVPRFPAMGTDLPQGVALSLGTATEFAVAPGPLARSSVKNLRPPPGDILALLPQVRDPALRVLLACAAGDKEMIAGQIPALQSVEKPSFTGVLLLAGWLESEGRREESAGVLKRAPQPLPPMDQLRLDGIQTFLGMEAVKNAKNGVKVNPADVETGRRAALRMQKAALTAVDRKTLAEAFEAFDLKEEGARTRALATNSRTSATSRVRPAQNNKSRAETLLGSGRKAEAMRLLVKELRDWSQMWIADKGAVTTTEMTKFKDGVLRLNLTDELLKASDPGETSDATALALRGAALEIFRGTGEAVEWYRRAFTAKPKSAELFSLLMRAGLQNDPASTGRILKGVDPAMLAQAAVALARIDRAVTSVNARASALEGLREWLDALDPESLRDADLRWASLWVSTLSVSQSNNEMRKFGNLTDTAPDIDRSEDEKLLRRRWYDASQKVDVLLMKNERSALIAFTSFISKRLAFEPKAERSDPDRMAREILERRQALKKSGRPMTEARFYWLSGSTSAIPQNMSSGEWILQSAVLQKNPEMVQDIVRGLKEAGATADAALMETVARLHFCLSAEFAEASKAAIEFSKEGNAMLDRIIAVMGERKLHTDLDAQVLKAVKDSLPSGRAADFVLSSYCLHLRRSQGYKATETFFAKATECYLGPLKDRAVFIAREYAPAKVQTGTAAGPVYAWLTLAGRVAGEPELSLLVLSALESEFSIHTGQRVDGTGLKGVGILGAGTFYRNPPDAVLVAFRGTPALAELAEFNLPLVTGRYGVPGVTDMMDSMRTSGNAPELRKALAAEPQTFGTRFIRAAIDESPGDALLTLAGNHSGALKKLPIERQQRIASLLEAAAPNIEPAAGKTETEAVKQGKAWLKSLRSREAF